MFTISVDPVAFTIGSIEVRWYGVIIAIAAVVVILWMVRQIDIRKSSLPARPDIVIAPVGIISGMIGAKLVHVLEKLDYYIHNPADILSGGGFGIWGAILGSTLGIWIYLRLSRKDKNQHFGFFADLAAPGIMLAQAIGRIGCTLNGCCHGKPAPDWLPWTIKYSADYPPPSGYAVEDPSFLAKALYPTQPAEIVFGLIVFGILLKLRSRPQPIEGALFMVYLAMYSAWRLGLGFFRTAEVYFVSGLLSQAQIISVVVLVVSIALLIYMRRFRFTKH
jgi:phosphatidylglycerol:prolipoprotein diacylglycerol transferase